VNLNYYERPAYRRARRVIDLAVAAVALTLTSPVLLLASLAIWLEDGGSAVFSQRRVGRFGRLFTMYKLRTMSRTLCGDARKPEERSDPRITRVGRVLRRTSIDELPQFFNVLKGEMSVVGPRPEMPFIVRGYEPWQHLRHLVPPGITGLWQTTCRSTIPLDRPEATHIDLEYVRHASTALDSQLIARTIGSIFTTRGAL
jgi:lipopolysaccharide/colanic/teichoic acid biosynthesis glycosyltransferase